MRYEAKHHYFKPLAVTTSNFINLPHTLSNQHQESAGVDPAVFFRGCRVTGQIEHAYMKYIQY